MRNEQETDRTTTLYSDTVHETCMLHLKSHADTEDVLQTASLRYVLYPDSFENSEHEKAWIIRVTINACKDYLKGFFRSYMVPLEEITEVAGGVSKEHSEVLEAVLSLPKKYRDVAYLLYCEDYTTVEISEVLGRNVNTVYMLLVCARMMLRKMPGGDDFEQSAETYV